MSHIFDALQKSESERSGETASFSLATELLQIAERDAAEQRVAEEVVRSLPVPVAENRASAVEPENELSRLPQKPSVPEGIEIKGQSEKDPRESQFSQFQSLRLLVPPQSRLVCLTERDSLAAEKFLFLSVRLRQLQQSKRLKKVLITSSIPQEGKSMVAANLACTLARRAEQKTLLIEGDLRRPSLAHLFGLGRLPGLSEWLQGESGSASSIYRLEEAGLWFLPAGNSPSNPLELMQSGKLSALMGQLTNWFDWVVIDSPPVLPLGDTSIWMRLADGVLLVARPGVTEKQQLKKGLEAIEQSKLVGALLNGSQDAAHSDYYQRYGPSAIQKKQPAQEKQSLTQS